MTTATRTGMGNRTILQYRRVADDILSYAQLMEEWEYLYPVNHKWHDHHGTVERMSGGNPTTRYTAYGPPSNYTYVSTYSPFTYKGHYSR